MKFIIPLKIKKIVNSISLPYSLLYNKNDMTIQIEKFSIKEREDFFSIKELKIDKTKYSYKIFEGVPQYLRSQEQEYLLANYKIIIESDTDNPTNLQKIQHKLDFVLKIILGCGIPITKIESNNTLYGGSKVSSGNVEVSRRNIETIDKKKLSSIKNLLKIIITNPPPKTEILQFFLETAMKQVPNMGISGAFYVTILESLIVPEKSSEIKYSLSMRLTKKRKKNTEYKKKIGDLYNKRSKVFHGVKDIFDKNDIIFLEKEVAWVIEEYLKNPTSFEVKKLDELLLN